MDTLWMMYKWSEAKYNKAWTACLLMEKYCDPFYIDPKMWDKIYSQTSTVQPLKFIFQLIFRFD